MKKIAVIIYGPPGSGKSTQAELVARRCGLIFFDTGKHIASVIYDPKNRNNKTITRQRMLYESGLLCERPWVLKLVSEGIKRVSQAGFGIVFGGSPRGAYEAFDSGNRKGVYSMLKQAYGKEHIYTFFLTIQDRETFKRNSTRKLCRVCDRAYLSSIGLEGACPFCGGPLTKRKDDNISIIGERIKEFKRETKPVIGKVKKIGFSVRTINGSRKPFQVFNSIIEWLP